MLLLAIVIKRDKSLLPSPQEWQITSPQSLVIGLMITPIAPATRSVNAAHLL
jgi:hypothetical protein